MSELRQRKGGDEKAVDSGKKMTEEEGLAKFIEMMGQTIEEKVRKDCEAQGITSNEEIQKKVAEAQKKMWSGPEKPLPGVNNQTFVAKRKLANDPYNMALISDLGAAYFEEEKWTECATVLIRGWKRVNELESADERYQFLYRLSLASWCDKKYKQALAVLMDMEPPEDEIFAQVHALLEVKVYAENKNLQKTLKAFNNAIEGCTWEEALKVFSHCAPYITQVDEAAYSSVAKLAPPDMTKEEVKKNLDLMRITGVMTAVRTDPRGRDQAVSLRSNKLFIVAGLVLLSIIVYVLYQLEMRSLRRLKLAD